MSSVQSIQKNACLLASNLAFDGIGMLPPTYCYLKLDFMPTYMTWFDQEQMGFQPKKVSQ